MSTTTVARIGLAVLASVVAVVVVARNVPTRKVVLSFDRSLHELVEPIVGQLATTTDNRDDGGVVPEQDGSDPTHRQFLSATLEELEPLMAATRRHRINREADSKKRDLDPERVPLDAVAIDLDVANSSHRTSPIVSGLAAATASSPASSVRGAADAVPVVVSAGVEGVVAHAASSTETSALAAGAGS